MTVTVSQVVDAHVTRVPSKPNSLAPASDTSSRSPSSVRPVESHQAQPLALDRTCGVDLAVARIDAVGLLAPHRPAVAGREIAPDRVAPRRRSSPPRRRAHRPGRGARLVLSEKTIETHLSRVFGKLGLRSRTQVAAQIA